MEGAKALRWCTLRHSCASVRASPVPSFVREKNFVRATEEDFLPNLFFESATKGRSRPVAESAGRLTSGTVALALGQINVSAAT